MFKSRLVNESAASASFMISELSVDDCSTSGPDALIRSVKDRGALALPE